MTVSKIASEIYQAAKAAEKTRMDDQFRRLGTCRSHWNWRAEWSHAMQLAWREVKTCKRFRVGDIVNVKFYGRIITDRITTVYGNGCVYCKSLECVSEEKLFPATDKQIDDFKREEIELDRKMQRMLRAGDRLLETLVEPEFV